MSFAKTPEGRKFLMVDMPRIVKALEKIAWLMETNPTLLEPAIGSFEEITPDELKELKTKQVEFDEFFEKMTKNFELKLHFPNQMESVKNIVRHAYVANIKA